jgi:hypothetical protein
MKKFITFLLLFAFTSMISFGNNLPNKPSFTFRDTLPDMCIIVPPGFVNSLNPFGVPISSSFPDELNYDTYKGCYYQFFAKNMKPTIAVRLIKFADKKEAAVAYKTSIDGHTNDWYGVPERLTGLGDSAYFNYEGADTIKCDECGLVVLKGLYVIYVSFKGAYEEATRGLKKIVARRILDLMYINYDVLSPRIRNRQD